METISKFEAGHRAKHIVDVINLEFAAKRYSEIVRRELGNYNPDNVMLARLRLCNAIIELMDDGDALAERECIMHDLRVDEDGNALPVES